MGKLTTLVKRRKKETGSKIRGSFLYESLTFVCNPSWPTNFKFLKLFENKNQKPKTIVPTLASAGWCHPFSTVFSRSQVMKIVEFMDLHWNPRFSNSCVATCITRICQVHQIEKSLKGDGCRRQVVPVLQNACQQHLSIRRKLALFLCHLQMPKLLHLMRKQSGYTIANYVWTGNSVLIPTAFIAPCCYKNRKILRRHRLRLLLGTKVTAEKLSFTWKLWHGSIDSTENLSISRFGHCDVQYWCGKVLNFAQIFKFWHTGRVLGPAVPVDSNRTIHQNLCSSPLVSRCQIFGTKAFSPNGKGNVFPTHRCAWAGDYGALHTGTVGDASSSFDICIYASIDLSKWWLMRKHCIGLSGIYWHTHLWILCNITSSWDVCSRTTSLTMEMKSV